MQRTAEQAAHTMQKLAGLSCSPSSRLAGQYVCRRRSLNLLLCVISSTSCCPGPSAAQPAAASCSACSCFTDASQSQNSRGLPADGGGWWAGRRCVCAGVKSRWNGMQQV